MDKLFAIAIPILPGKTEQWKKFSDQLRGERYSEFAANRRNLNVRERTFLQETPMGDFVLVTLEGPNPENAFKEFAKGNDEFTNWFVKEAAEIHGMDLRNPPEGPMPTLVVDTEAQAMPS